MSELRCDEFVELVTAYLDGSLDAETEQRVEANLAVCEGCSTYLDQIRQMVAAAGSLPSEAQLTDALPDDARETLLDAFRRS
jgi:anti-sigma factor RsiW